MAKSQLKNQPADRVLAQVQRSKRRMQSGIALKFAVPVSLVVVVMMAILGLSIRSSTANALERSIQEKGIFAAITAAAPDWHHEDNLKRLSSMLVDTVEDVIIWEPRDGKTQAMVRTASGRSELAIQRGSPDYAPGSTVRVERGSMTNRSGRIIPYRSFSQSITAPGDAARIIGSVEVILSEEAIEEQLGSITSSIIWITVLGILFGVGISVLSARAITKPLNELIRDVEVVAGGNLNHRTRVRSTDEVGLLAQTFDEMTRELAEKVKLQEDLSSKQHEEQVTQEIQERLFPAVLPQIPENLVEAVMEPASAIASDMFDFVELGEGKTGFLVMSASGRGVPAAVVLAMARSTFRSVASLRMGPAETLRRINTLFSPDLRRGMYVTALYLVHDATTSKVLLASAGHKVPALYFAHSRKAVGKVHPPGIAMGLDKGPVFDRTMQEAEVELLPGDAIVLTTDGVQNLKLESGEPLGEQRFQKSLASVLESVGDGALERLVQKINANLAKDPGEHDVLLVALRRNLPLTLKG